MLGGLDLISALSSTQISISASLRHDPTNQHRWLAVVFASSERELPGLAGLWASKVRATAIAPLTQYGSERTRGITLMLWEILPNARDR